MNHTSKNSMLVDPRAAHHAPCAHYFDDHAARDVRHGPEAALYDGFSHSGLGQFSFAGCCKKGGQGSS